MDFKKLYSYEIDINMQNEMKRAYANGLLSKDYKYLLPYKEFLGNDRFNDLYDMLENHITKNYDVALAFTDSEGLPYYKLVPKK